MTRHTAGPMARRVADTAILRRPPASSQPHLAPKIGTAAPRPSGFRGDALIVAPFKTKITGLVIAYE